MASSEPSALMPLDTDDARAVGTFLTLLSFQTVSHDGPKTGAYAACGSWIAGFCRDARPRVGRPGGRRELDGRPGARRGQTDRRRDVARRRHGRGAARAAAQQPLRRRAGRGLALGRRRAVRAGAPRGRQDRRPRRAGHEVRRRGISRGGRRPSFFFSSHCLSTREKRKLRSINHTPPRDAWKRAKRELPRISLSTSPCDRSGALAHGGAAAARRRTAARAAAAHRADVRAGRGDRRRRRDGAAARERALGVGRTRAGRARARRGPRLDRRDVRRLLRRGAFVCVSSDCVCVHGVCVALALCGCVVRGNHLRVRVCACVCVARSLCVARRAGAARVCVARA